MWNLPMRKKPSKYQSSMTGTCLATGIPVDRGEGKQLNALSFSDIPPSGCSILSLSHQSSTLPTLHYQPTWPSQCSTTFPIDLPEGLPLSFLTLHLFFLHNPPLPTFHPYNPPNLACISECKRYHAKPWQIKKKHDGSEK